MQKHLLSLILAYLTMIAPVAAADEPPQVIFNPRVFSDMGDTVHVEGTVTGDGIGYKNNRSALTCYQQRKECLVVHMESEGMQVFSIGPPSVFTIRVWTADRITADLDAPCGNPPSARFKDDWQVTESHTWIIDRTRQTAELVDHNCLGAKTYHWTIEDPPFWGEVKHRVDDPKPSR